MGIRARAVTPLVEGGQIEESLGEVKGGGVAKVPKEKGKITQSTNCVSS